MQRNLPLVITFFGALIMFLQYFIPNEASKNLYENVLNWEIVAATFFLILGVESLFSYHLGKIRGRHENWEYSVVTIASLLVMSFVGLFGGISNDPMEIDKDVVSVQAKDPYLARELVELGKTHPDLAKTYVGIYDKDTKFVEKLLELRPDIAKKILDIWNTNKAKGDSLALAALIDPDETRESLGDIKPYPAVNRDSPLFQQIFNFMVSPMSATMFSLLAFFIASASYRAFRARNFESALLLVVAVIMMLGRIPFGEGLWPKLPAFTEYILEIPNNAMKRGISLGVGMGMLATSIKIMFGIDRSYLGGGD
jgi:hypothetical protein